MTKWRSHGASLYSASLEPRHPVDVSWVPGSDTPVQLSLALRNHKNLVEEGASYQLGATLILTMEKEAALEIYSQIRQKAQELGWTLSEGDGDQA